MMSSDPAVKKTELRALSEQRCWELLALETIGRLAVTIAGEPDIFPVNYQVDGNTIVIQTAPGTKLAAAIDHAVAFEVDVHDDAERTGWSVVVRGRSHEPKHIEDYLSACDLDIEPWAAGERSRFIVIDAQHISGRVLPPAATGRSISASSATHRQAAT